VTGASGFLGKAVVQAFLSRGHRVRALVRPSSKADELPWAGSVEIFWADLRFHPDLAAAFENIDVLAHLAACVVGDDADHYSSTIAGTERLLDAMAESAARRLVLASSFSVYGWREAVSLLDESSPPPANIHASGAYAVAKIWQERIARRMSRAHGWDLTVLRPGVIFGPGHKDVPLIGPALGRIQTVIGLGRHLPLTFVDNCADCFVQAAEHPGALGETFNVIDTDEVTAWQYAGEKIGRTQSHEVRVPVPYSALMLNAVCASACSRWLFKGRGKLPGMLRPEYVAYFRPLRFSNRKLREKLGWQPAWSFEQALERTFESQE
jgi:nucleoside-diphosphate-sugar epimerase